MYVSMTGTHVLRQVFHVEVGGTTGFPVQSTGNILPFLWLECRKTWKTPFGINLSI